MRGHGTRWAAVTAVLWLVAGIAPGSRAQVPAASGPPAAVTGEVRVEPQRATIGDVLLLSVSVDVPPGCTVMPPRVEGRLGPFQVLSRESEPARPGTGSGRREVWRYRIVPWTTGTLQVPGLKVEWQDGRGDAGAWTSLPVPVTVASVLKEGETEIAGWKPPEIIPDDWTWTILSLGALVVLLAMLVALAFWLRSRRRRGRAEVEAPPLPAHVKALGRLRALETAGPPVPEKTKPFYVELSEALREYVYGRWGIDALERTTTELHFELHRARLSSGLSADLLAILSAADLAKFARFVPPREETAGYVRAAIGLVEQTIPPPESPTGPREDAPATNTGDAA